MLAEIQNTPNHVPAEDTRTVSLIDLAEILDQHKLWVESGGESGSKADLCGANLKGALLEDAYLYGAVFDALTIWPDGYTPDTKTKDNGRPDVR